MGAVFLLLPILCLLYRKLIIILWISILTITVPGAYFVIWVSNKYPKIVPHREHSMDKLFINDTFRKTKIRFTFDFADYVHNTKKPKMYNPEVLDDIDIHVIE